MAVLFSVLLAGCLGEPEIEDRWTRIDVLEASLQPGQVLLDESIAVTVRSEIVYRSVMSGFVVAEIRVSDAIAIDQTQIAPDAPRHAMAAHIDSVLANSVTAGRGVRPMVGWDHLVRGFELSFTARVPAVSDSAASLPGIFLLTYLAEGEEIRLVDGRDSLVVTPYVSSEYEILPVGLELLAPGAGSAPP